MSVLKTPTDVLRLAGYEYLQVHKGLYGYYILDKRFTRQQGTTVRDTAWQPVVDVLKHGLVPVETTDRDEPALLDVMRNVRGELSATTTWDKHISSSLQQLNVAIARAEGAVQ